MAIIGFIVLLLAALYFTYACFAGTALCLGFSGKVQWSFTLPTGVVATALWYVVFNNAPFTVTFS